MGSCVRVRVRATCVLGSDALKETREKSGLRVRASVVPCRLARTRQNRIPDLRRRHESVSGKYHGRRAGEI